MSINFPNADFTPQLVGYTGQGAFRFWCQKVLPIVYDDSLSYYELLNKVVNYLNNAIRDISSLADNNTALYNAFIALQNYVNDYFDSLDVEEAIDNKLDRMAESGELTQIFFSWASLGYLNFVTPELFGAVGDGETDDSQAFNDMFDYLILNGGTALLGGKTYAIGSTIQKELETLNTTSFSVIGCGDCSVLKRIDSCNHVFLFRHLQNATFCDFRVDANSEYVSVPSNSHACFNCLSCKHLHFVNLTLERFEFCGVQSYVVVSELNEGFYSEDITFDHVFFDGSSNFNPAICDGFQNVYHSGAVIVNTDNSEFRNCVAKNCNSYGMEFKGYLTGYSNRANKNNRYSNCLFENVYRAGVYLGGQSEVALNTFHDIVNADNITCINCCCDTELDYSNNVSIDGLNVYKNETYPFEFRLQFGRFRRAKNINCLYTINLSDSSEYSTMPIFSVTDGSNRINIVISGDNFTEAMRCYGNDESCSDVSVVRMAVNGTPLFDLNSFDWTRTANYRIFDFSRPNEYLDRFKEIIFGNPSAISRLGSAIYGLLLAADSPVLKGSYTTPNNFQIQGLSNNGGGMIRFSDASLGLYVLVDSVFKAIAYVNGTSVNPGGADITFGANANRWSDVFANKIDVEGASPQLIIKEPDGGPGQIQYKNGDNGVSLRLENGSITLYDIVENALSAFIKLSSSGIEPFVNDENLGSNSRRFNSGFCKKIDLDGATPQIDIKNTDSENAQIRYIKDGNGTSIRLRNSGFDLYGINSGSLTPLVGMSDAVIEPFNSQNLGTAAHKFNVAYVTELRVGNTVLTESDLIALKALLS